MRAPLRSSGRGHRRGHSGSCDRNWRVRPAGSVRGRPRLRDRSGCGRGSRSHPQPVKVRCRGWCRVQRRARSCRAPGCSATGHGYRGAPGTRRRRWRGQSRPAHTFSFGLIGAFDDIKKIRTKSSAGISLKIKILFQILLALIGIFILYAFSDFSEIKNLYFPFFKNLIINLGWFFVPFYLFVIVGSSNAVNLTDGLDGLATVPVILVAACFAFISYVTGNIVFSDYLHIPYIGGAGEVTVFCGAIIGSCLGFLWFNAPPAKIFMGDTGSLALGGSLGSIGIITKHEIVLAITGGLFVFEAISVIVQVLSFKLTGKRVFKMAPVHHHFEKKGWPESTVVIRFWIISIILAMIGLATLKLR